MFPSEHACLAALIHRPYFAPWRRMRPRDLDLGTVRPGATPSSQAFRERLLTSALWLKKLRVGQACARVAGRAQALARAGGRARRPPLDSRQWNRARPVQPRFEHHLQARQWARRLVVRTVRRHRTASTVNEATIAFLRCRLLDQELSVIALGGASATVGRGARGLKPTPGANVPRIN